MSLVTPAALATMAGVLVLWAGSHFFGVGVVADAVLLTVGLVALGGVALEAGNHLYQFGKLTLAATRKAELEQAASHLAKAISLIGVQAVLALLLRHRPATFNQRFSKLPAMAPLRQMRPLPRTPGLFYKPKFMVTNKLFAGEGRTNAAGDIRLGRWHAGNAVGAAEGLRLAAYHERVHQLLTPRLQVFRELQVYLKQSGYQKSFILRYLEEALAETISPWRVYRVSKSTTLCGLKFPINAHYEITVAQVGAEARGILLGPIVVGGMLLMVHHGLWTERCELAS